jgi:hypothetical protein
MMSEGRSHPEPSIENKAMKERNQLIYLYFCSAIAGKEEWIWPDLSPMAGSKLVELAELEGIAPLLYWRLKGERWPVEMPDTTRSELSQSYYNTVAQNSLLIQELFQVLDVFSQAGIPVIVLKGGALVWFYEEIGLRPMRDLDLLIPREQVTEALELLQKLKYHPAEVEIVPRINRRIVHNTYLRGGPDDRVGLEIHWDLIAGQADDRFIDTDWFWQQVESLPVKGGRFSSRVIPQLHPTAHLLYITAHLMLRHGGNNERLIWFYDVDRLIRSGRVDWAMFETQAHRLGWGVVARYVLEGAAARFETPIPETLSLSLASGQEWETFLNERRKKAASFSRLEHTWQSLKHFSWPLRLRMIFALFFPRPDYIRWRYAPHPAWIWPLYYVYRWGDVSKEILQALFRPVKQGNA